MKKHIVAPDVLCNAIDGGAYFEWLLTRFSTPEELFPTMKKHIVAPDVLAGLWERLKSEVEAPIAMFVRNGIKPIRGEQKKTAEFKVWSEVARVAFEEGVRIGYDMGMVVAGAPDPKDGE
jgi:hypothetical protein